MAAGSGNYTYFFEALTVPELLKSHIADTEEMITRDKNHPSVIAWSLFNEPETITDMHMNILRKYLQQQKHTTFRVDQ